MPRNEMSENMIITKKLIEAGYDTDAFLPCNTTVIANGIWDNYIHISKPYNGWVPLKNQQTNELILQLKTIHNETNLIPTEIKLDTQNNNENDNNSENSQTQTEIEHHQYIVVHPRGVLVQVLKEFAISKILWEEDTTFQKNKIKNSYYCVICVCVCVCVYFMIHMSYYVSICMCVFQKNNL